MKDEHFGCIGCFVLFLTILGIIIFIISKPLGAILFAIIGTIIIAGIILDKRAHIKQIKEQEVWIELQEAEREEEEKKKREEERRYFQKLQKLDQLQNLSGSEFESLVAKIFQQMGYKVTITPKTGDEGIDIDTIDPQGKKVVIQCKRWQGTISSKVVREFYGSLMHAKAEKGFLVTTGTFSSSAIAFAEGKPISLVDGKDFIDTMMMLEESPQQESTCAQKAQLEQEFEADEEHRLIPVPEKSSQQEDKQVKEEQSELEHGEHKPNKREAKLVKHKLQEKWREKKISNLHIGWMIWWRAFVPLAITSVPFRQEIVAVWLVVLILFIFLLDWAGKVIVRRKYGLNTDRFIGWSIWWRTVLPVFFIGIISFGLFDTSFVGWIIFFWVLCIFANLNSRMGNKSGNL